MSLRDSGTSLSEAARSFRHVWKQAGAHWHDRQASAFEQRYVALLDVCVRSALRGMEHMDHTLTQARRECE